MFETGGSAEGVPGAASAAASVAGSAASSGGTSAVESGAASATASDAAEADGVGEAVLPLPVPETAVQPEVNRARLSARAKEVRMGAVRWW